MEQSKLRATYIQIILMMKMSPGYTFRKTFLR